MNVLLIAYEFPPSPSPQSLRWMYFARELVSQGHRVDVLTARIADCGNSPRVPVGVHVHTCSPGPIHSAMDFLRRRRPARPSSEQQGCTSTVAAPPVPLNWKGKALERFIGLAGRCIFPDIRGEWRFTASRQLRSILAHLRPDVVVSSHEPATSLEVGLLAKRAGYPWVVDLGDPVLAPYTPQRWHAKARRLEREVSNVADAVVVTNEKAATLMRTRHGTSESRLHVITQGFDESLAVAPAASTGADTLELFYSGSLYTFRRIDRLLEAVRSMGGVHLTIASSHWPIEVARAIELAPERVRHLGFLSHEETLLRQREADVLVNLGNEDPCQVPGKVFEYLGAGRPILHVCEQPTHDDTAALISQMRAGLAVEDTVEAIVGALRVLSERRRSNETFAVPRSVIERYGWTALGGRYGALLQRVAA